ncbi:MULTISPECIES: DUF5007 domain-containing protein [Sphingobacterium]|uniref:DUF5007 domain-containing protein n=1 Tax=Sphingobacterium TaxID=28453 RepID=UPI002242E231|nr:MULTISPECIES: DUF5007 domain-containing protein [Sphingobacterium]MCW8313029.1 DUF5007 domain-containing protein [Sphingobacterium sp. InxBP1]
MKANLKIFYTLTFIVGLMAACKKIDNGFLSDGIRYKDNTIYCKRGMSLVMSDRINTDGSTPPYEFELLNLREESSNKPAPEAFFKQFDLLTFKPGMVFNAETDTTIELLNKKRETVSKTPMEFNKVSGQLVFNRASANLPLGRYTFDVKMKNPKGEKLFPKLASIEVVEPSIDDMFQVTYQAASGSTASEVFTTITAPKIACKKISNDGARVLLKIVDKNGVAFNPKNGEIVKRGDRPMFETHVKFNPVQFTDNALICDFEVAPFPLTKYIDKSGTDWGFLIYYRIPMKYAQVDGLPAHNVNPVFGFQILMEGTYEVEVKLPTVTRVMQ